MCAGFNISDLKLPSHPRQPEFSGQILRLRLPHDRVAIAGPQARSAQRLSVLSREVEVGYGKDGALRLGKRRGARFPLSHNLGCGEQSLTFHEPGN